jgi:isocitrate lyase
MLQTPELRQEQPAHDEAEAARLAELVQLVTTAAPLPDLRDLAPAVRALFPEPAYTVGCGGSHIWLHRTHDPHRLAFILDHYQ